MKYYVTFFQLVILFSSGSSFAQDIEEFMWKNRLIILSVDAAENEQYKAQVNSLKSDPEGLDVRKLIVITLIPDFQLTGLSANIRQNIDSSYDKFLSDQRPFMFYLIGLDGGIKFSSPTIVGNKELFSLIDVMPMRRLEIENNNKSKKD